MKRIVLLTALCFVSSLAFSQSSDLGNWMIYFGNKKLSDRWNWHHEVQYRNYNAIGDLEQLLLRTGIGYNLSENNNNILLGYGYIHSENYIDNVVDKAFVNEHRIFQQFISHQGFGRFKIQHRYRFEQRWIEEGIFKMRFRYFLALNLLLCNPESVGNTFYLSAYNEIFINDRGDAFDRNRLYGGIGFKPNKSVRFEVGYMNQFFNVGGRDQLNLITFFNF